MNLFLSLFEKELNDMANKGEELDKEARNLHQIRLFAHCKTRKQVGPCGNKFTEIWICLP